MVVRDASASKKTQASGKWQEREKLEMQRAKNSLGKMRWEGCQLPEISWCQLPVDREMQLMAGDGMEQSLECGDNFKFLGLELAQEPPNGVPTHPDIGCIFNCVSS